MTNKVHILLTHLTEDGKQINIPWIPTQYRNSRDGAVVVKEGHWFPVLIIDENRSEPCRMPLRLLEQRTQDDKARQATERREFDRQAILDIKLRVATGHTIMRN